MAKYAFEKLDLFEPLRELEQYIGNVLQKSDELHSKVRTDLKQLFPTVENANVKLVHLAHGAIAQLIGDARGNDYGVKKDASRLLHWWGISLTPETARRARERRQ